MVVFRVHFVDPFSLDLKHRRGVCGKTWHIHSPMADPPGNSVRPRRKLRATDCLLPRSCSKREAGFLVCSLCCRVGPVLRGALTLV